MQYGVSGISIGIMQISCRLSLEMRGLFANFLYSDSVIAKSAKNGTFYKPYLATSSGKVMFIKRPVF